MLIMGNNFVAESFKAECQKHGIKLIFGRPYSPPLFPRFSPSISKHNRHSCNRRPDPLPAQCIPGAKKCPLRSTVKEKESGAVFSEILRFLSIIRGVFLAVDRIPGIRCSPESSEGKKRPIWSYFGCLASDLTHGQSIDIQYMYTFYYVFDICIQYQDRYPGPEDD